MWHRPNALPRRSRNTAAHANIRGRTVVDSRSQRPPRHGHGSKFPVFTTSIGAGTTLARLMHYPVDTPRRELNGGAAMDQPLTTETLRAENRRYRDSSGISPNNRCAGFAPAFCDCETGRTELSRFAGGLPAPCHLIDGLPNDWVVKRDTVGHTVAIKTSVIAGFVRDGRFYTREQAARALLR
jgi:hypothetical protein